MPKVKQKKNIEGDNPTRVTKEEVRVSLNNAFALSRNHLDWFLSEAEKSLKVDGNGVKVRRRSPRVLASFTKELVEPLLAMVHDGLILKEEMIVALCGAALMVNQKEL